MSRSNRGQESNPPQYNPYEITPLGGGKNVEQNRRSFQQTIDVLARICQQHKEAETFFEGEMGPDGAADFIRELAEKITRKHRLEYVARDKQRRKLTMDKLVDILTAIYQQSSNLDFTPARSSSQECEDGTAAGADVKRPVFAGLTSADNWADSVYTIIKQTGRLPSPPKVMLQIRQLAADDETTKADIARIAGEDPALAARIIKYVNSPFAGRATKVTSIFEAVNVLGIETVKNLALGVALVSQCKMGPCVNFDYGGFWSASVAQATAAGHLAAAQSMGIDKSSGINKDIAFTAGLLCQIGRLALATVFPGEYAQLLSRVKSSDSALLCEPEGELFGIDHNELSARMMADWSLPEYFRRAVQLQDSLTKIKRLPSNAPELKLVRILRWAKVMTAVFLQPSRFPRSVLQGTIVAAGSLGIKAEDFSENFDQIALEWSQMASVFELTAAEVPRWDEIYALAS